MYSRKDTSLNYIEFLKNQTRIGRYVWFLNSYKGKFYFEPCLSIIKKLTTWDNLKSRNKSNLVKTNYRQSGKLLFMMLKTSDSYLYREPNLAKNQKWVRSWTSVLEYMKQQHTARGGQSGRTHQKRMKQ